MKKRMTGLALMLCLLLTACGGKEADSQGQAPLLGGAAGLEEAAVLLTVDGREVAAWRYLYWLADACGRIQAQYEEAEMPLDWTDKADGGTLADYARDQALADTVLYATVENWAERYGCALDDGDRASLAEAWQAAAESRGGEAAYLAELERVGLDRDRAEELAGVGALYAKLYQLYDAADGPLAPEEEALRAFAEAQGCLTLDRILISAGEDREAARQKAAEVFAQLNGAADQAAAFSTLAAAGADTAGPRTLTAEDGTLESSLVEAAETLAEGACSGILESSEGFSILRRLPTDTGAVREAYFDHLLQEDAKNAEVRTGQDWESVDPAAFFQALEQLRAEEAAGQPE
jgi:hypothetical protein